MKIYRQQELMGKELENKRQISVSIPPYVRSDNSLIRLYLDYLTASLMLFVLVYSHEMHRYLNLAVIAAAVILPYLSIAFGRVYKLKDLTVFSLKTLAGISLFVIMIPRSVSNVQAVLFIIAALLIKHFSENLDFIPDFLLAGIIASPFADISLAGRNLGPFWLYSLPVIYLIYRRRFNIMLFIVFITVLFMFGKFYPVSGNTSQYLVILFFLTYPGILPHRMLYKYLFVTISAIMFILFDIWGIIFIAIASRLLH